MHSTSIKRKTLNQLLDIQTRPTILDPYDPSFSNSLARDIDDGPYSLAFYADKSREKSSVDHRSNLDLYKFPSADIRPLPWLWLDSPVAPIDPPERRLVKLDFGPATRRDGSEEESVEKRWEARMGSKRGGKAAAEEAGGRRKNSRVKYAPRVTIGQVRGNR
ncbi:hypothetical protein KM043_002143 [Ampulex compressa]|nr:hypothetical protein KM043_002143 [Ampulex compressa]